MKGSWKRILSLLLIAAMVLTLGPVGFAADNDDEIVVVETEEMAAADEVRAVADGYYLVGTMNEWTPEAAYKFELNPNNSSEYMLKTTLTEETQMKVVKVENGENATWYPNGDNYTVNADQAGNVVIYFKPILSRCQT